MNRFLFLQLMLAVIITSSPAHRVLLAKGQQSDGLPKFVQRPGAEVIQLKDYTERFQKLYNKQKSGNGLKRIPEALRFAEYRFGKASQQYAEVLSWGCLFAKQVSEYQQATNFGIESLSILEKILGKEHPDVANALNQLGLVYHVSDNHSQAEDLYLRAASINSNVYGADNYRVATNLRNLGLLLSNLSEPQRAEPVLLRVLEINQKNYGEKHESIVRSHNELGLLYKKNK